MQSVGGYGVLAVACASSWLYPPKFPLLEPMLHTRGEEGFKVGYRFRHL